MSDLTATAESILKLENMVASAPKFQLHAGVSTALAAKKYIHYPRYVPTSPEKECRPFSVITPRESQTNLIAGGGKNYFVLGGTLELQLCLEIDDLSNQKAEYLRFLDFEESIWRHCLDLAALDDNLAIVDMPLQERVESALQYVADNKAQRPFYKAVYLVTWGNL